jgi:glycosyltransferase involved in cell wall biosynthesis
MYVRPLRLFNNQRFIWALICISKIIKELHVDILWEPTTFLPLGCKVKTIVTVHDVVNKEHPQTMNLLMRIMFDVFHPIAIRKADKIWANSQYTVDMINKYYPKRRCRETEIGDSIDMNFYKLIEVSIKAKRQLLETLGIIEEVKLLLFVGTLEPRKNLKHLLSLMPLLAKKGFELIIVGGKGWGSAEIADIINEKDYPKQKIHFAGYLTNEELLSLYNIVDCYVSTSLNEGFGMPQLEAIACGVPVVTADNSAMREVVSDAGVLVAGWDKDFWIECIEEAVNNKKDIISRYPQKLKEYDWNTIAERIAKYIER